MSHLNNTGQNNNDQITQQEAWGILDSFFNEKGLVRQQIESYDEFLCDNIPKIIETSQPIEVDISGPLITTKYYYKFTNTYIGFPKVLEADGSLTDLTPNTARLRNLCYEVPIYITINYKKIEIDNKSGEQKIIEEKDDTTKFCNVPLMLNSKHCFLHGKSDKERILLGECEYDQGGYFIVNGSEKVLIAQERLATNQVYVFLNKSNSYFAEIRSIQEGEFKSANQLLVKYLLPPKKNTIVNEKILRVTIPYIKKDIPLFIVFMALGITNKDDIMKRIISENDESYEGRDPKTDEYLKILNYSYEESFIITNQEDALDYIGKRTTLLCDTREKRITCVLKIFQKEFLPHLSVDDDSFGIKSYFFGYIVKKLLDTVLEKRQVDDRDNFGNKRLDLSSTLLGNMFRISFTKVIREFKIIVEKHIQTSKSIFIKNDLNGKDITKDLRYAMSTGNWGSSKQKITKTGVAQALNRLSYSATLSHLRRVVAPIAKDGKSMKPRQLHNTSILQMCPSETPEGHGCGIVKNMTLLTHLSLNSSSDLVDEFLDNPENNMRLIRLKEISDKNISVNGIKVFLNGKWIGVHNNSSELLKYLINLRRSGKINYDVSIKILNEELCIDTDGGRCCVPLIVVKDNKLTITKDDIYKLKEGSKIWSDLVREGKIEYLDVNEMATSLIASTYNDLQEYSQIGYNYTHCEIHPSMILGVCASMIPFPDHNQAPRNTYQSAMSKQAMGIYATNYNMRMDTMAHVLFYPQKPMMQTKSSKYLNYGEMPAGHNCIVAIACYSGFNQEDSLIINKSAVDRGMFRSIFYRSYKDEENKKMNGLVEEFGLPDPNTVMGTKNNNYNNIDEDGLPKVGASYNSHEILVGKTVPIQTPVNSQNPSKMLMSKYTHKDVSMPIRTAESGIVDQVMISTNLDGKKFTKIRMRSIRVPEIGDKAASRHGQKGTMGALFNQEDMPFTKDGITPDIIVNAHAIPSRMTIAQIIECVGSKAGIMNGDFKDATPFEKFDVNTLCNELHKSGFQRHGYEVLYNGYTGLKMPCQIFIGPTYYQRLKHLVNDKIHSRNYGPLQGLIRQPTEGRSREGGLRFGEMERDCMISHGAANFLREKLFIDSDKFQIDICELCGITAIANNKTNTVTCKSCNSVRVKKINIPYATKLLFQELMAMNIAPRIKLSEI